MIKKTGYPNPKMIKSKFPPIEQLTKPKAIIECYQEIPCNPCSTSCPFEAITIGDNINRIPTIDFSKCVGCGVCVYSCPGLAIMVVNISQHLAHFKIPYELQPLPKTGEDWDGLNRQGKVICKARIESVTKNEKTDRTAVVNVSVPIEFLYEFITVRCPYE